MSKIRIIKAISAALLFCYFLAIKLSPGVLADQRDFIQPAAGSIILHFRDRYQDTSAGKMRTHYGIDIAASEGSPVFASASGKVSFAGFTPAGGQTVSISHPGGIKTTYLQLKEIRVSRGDVVSQDQLIGVVARQGDKSSPQSHLHMGASIGKIYIDPEELFSGQFRLDLSKFIRRGNIPPDFKSPDAENSQKSYGFLKLIVTRTNPKRSDLVAPKLFTLAKYLFAKFKTSKIISKTFKLVNRFINSLVRFGKFIFRQTCRLAGTIFRLTIKQFSRLAKGIKFGLDQGLGWFRGFLSKAETRFPSLKSLLFDRARFFLAWLGIEGHRAAGIEPQVFDPSGDNEGNPRSWVLIPVQDGVLKINIYDPTGTLIQTLKNWQRAGRFISWDGINQNGDIAQEGVYTFVAQWAGKKQKKIGQVEVRYHLR